MSGTKSQNLERIIELRRRADIALDARNAAWRKSANKIFGFVGFKPLQVNEAAIAAHKSLQDNFVSVWPQGGQSSLDRIVANGKKADAELAARHDYWVQKGKNLLSSLSLKA